MDGMNLKLWFNKGQQKESLSIIQSIIRIMESLDRCLWVFSQGDTRLPSKLKPWECLKKKQLCKLEFLHLLTHFRSMPTVHNSWKQYKTSIFFDVVVKQV